MIYDYGTRLRLGKLYAYGMRLRPREPGGQPNGYKDWQDFDTRCELPSGDRVWSILWYDRILSDEEVANYELVRLEGEDK